MTTMIHVDWDEFRMKNKDAQGAFEDLCYFLFCREYRLTEGIFGYKNQTGIEKEPVFIKDKWRGFQAKFFDHTINWQEIKDSIEKAKRKNANLQVIRFYIYQEFSESSKPDKKKSNELENAEKFAEEKGIEIEWFGPSQFAVSLNKQENLDLAQLYFGIGDEFGFLNNNLNPAVQTFLQSPAYMTLPVTDIDGRKIKDITNEILRSREKLFLVSGHPGCGESILIHNLFRVYSGIDKRTIRESKRVLQKNHAIPMRVDLKLYAGENLETVIRDRQNDYKLRQNSPGFIYLFDGLDELDAQKVELALTYLTGLSAHNTTKKIIFSCRSGNFNRIRARACFNNIVEYKIDSLNDEDIKRYFTARRQKNKIQRLTLLLKKNSLLLNGVHDILLVQLLWETIESLDEKSTVFDFLSKKIELLLSSPSHNKNLESLNLLDEKRERIFEINRDLSFEIQNKFQFRFPRHDLQRIVMEKFPRCDYKSVNDIIAYLSGLFFEKVYAVDSRLEENFIYQHRRYQEFFFIQKLKEEYEKNPKVLRNVNVLTNSEFLQKFFFRYLREEYEEEQNVSGFLSLNLLEMYLEDAYHWNSSEMLPALVTQKDALFNELWYSEDFGLIPHFLLKENIAQLESTLKKWVKNKNDYRCTDSLTKLWEDGIGSIIENGAIFIEAQKSDIAKQMLRNLGHIRSLYEKYRFLKLLDKNRRPKDPFWEHWEDWIFFYLSFHERDGGKVLNKFVRQNYKSISEPAFPLAFEEQGKDRLVNGFFRALIRKDFSQVLALLDSLDDFEFSALLQVLCSLKYLPYFLRDLKIQGKIKVNLERRKPVVSDSAYFLGFYKAFFGIKMSKAEKEILRKKLQKASQDRQMDWHFHNTHRVYALLSFSLGVNKFSDITNPQPIRSYNELGLYGALFADFIFVGIGKKSIAEVMRDYRLYTVRHTESLHGFSLRRDMSILWANIFALRKTANDDTLTSVKMLLFENEEDGEKNTNVSAFWFHLELRRLDPGLYARITNESEIAKLETVIIEPDDYQSLIDNFFRLSLLFSTLNPIKSRVYFIRGMAEGILRHYWRKDTLVSYQLVDSLKLLWEKNFATKDELEAYARKVFALALKVAKLTDGKETWQGPYHVVQLVSKYNLPLATDFKEQLIKSEGRRGFSNWVITSILLGHVRRGAPLSEIEDGMIEYRTEYNYEGIPHHDVFEQKIEVYVAMAESDLYMEQERKNAFEKAYEQVEEMKRENVTYFLSDADSLELKRRLISLSQKYDKKPNVTIEKKEEGYETKPDERIEQKFLRDVEKAKTPQKIRSLYRRLSNYKNNIVLTKKDSWGALLMKTQDVCGSISPFINLLERFHFPHTDNYTTNSKYFYFALAIALDVPTMKIDALRHLYTKTGHGGFKNMIKVYAEMGDKEMCRKLFDCYFQICDFLAN